jgi:hypothetical protein
LETKCFFAQKSNQNDCLFGNPKSK